MSNIEVTIPEEVHQIGCPLSHWMIDGLLAVRSSISFGRICNSVVVYPVTEIAFLFTAVVAVVEYVANRLFQLITCFQCNQTPINGTILANRIIRGLVCRN